MTSAAAELVGELHRLVADLELVETLHRLVAAELQ